MKFEGLICNPDFLSEFQIRFDWLLLQLNFDDQRFTKIIFGYMHLRSIIEFDQKGVIAGVQSIWSILAEKDIIHNGHWC